MRNIAQRIRYTKQSPQRQFITYIRTLQWFRSRLKDIDVENESIHIPSSEIEERFFPYPQYKRIDEINNLCNQNEISYEEVPIKNGKVLFKYKALKPGDVNLALLKPRYKESDLNDLHRTMRTYLMNVDLEKNSSRTKYFDSFLKFKTERPDLFFIVDDFVNRVHTPVSNFKSEYRNNIRLYGEGTTSLDVQTMQPILLGEILKDKIGDNEFTQWTEKGQDVYVMLQEKANLKTRVEAKKRFFEILFSPKSDELDKIFGGANWIQWVNKFKSEVISENPHSQNKKHSNLAWLLQSKEVEIMEMVWKELIKYGIPFLSVHDEVIIRKKDENKALEIFQEVFSGKFKFFRINSKDTDINK